MRNKTNLLAGLGLLGITGALAYYYLSTRKEEIIIEPVYEPPELPPAPPPPPSQPQPPFFDPSMEFSGNGLKVAQRVLSWWRVILQWAESYQIHPALISAIIHHESGGNPCAVNKTDPSYGLMQICCQPCEPCQNRPRGVRACHPCCGCLNYKGEIGTCGQDYAEGLFDPSTNIERGAWYLRYLTNKYGDNLNCIISAYNAGTCKLWKNPLYVYSVSALYNKYLKLWG